MKFLVTCLTAAAAVFTFSGHLQAADLAKGAHHTISSKDVTCSVGKECVVTVSLDANDKSYHINEQYPAKFKAEELAGVEFLGTDAGGKNVFSKAAKDYVISDAQHSTLTIKFKPTKAGSLSIAGLFKFCVCSEKECVPDSATLKIPVTVK